MTALPPIGSLWQHRFSGVQRRVVHIDDGTLQDVHYADNLSRFTTSRRLCDWLAWQANADRIDTAPQGQGGTDA